MATEDSNDVYHPRLITAAGEVVDDPTYTISRTPLFDDELPEEAQQEFVRLTGLCVKKPAKALPQLLAFRDRHPENPRIVTWIITCHQALGRDEQARAELVRLRAEHPDYLFGLVLEAQGLVEAGDDRAVRRLFNNRFDLKLLYPHRSVFHFTEAVAFWTMLVCYYLLTNDLEKAAFYLDELDALEPNHPNKRRLNAMFDAAMDRLNRRTAAPAAGPAKPFRAGSHMPKKDRNRKKRRR